MPDFSEVIEELTGAGYTPTEAIQATVALTRIPQIETLLVNPVAYDFIVATLLNGYKPTSEQQRIMVEGITSFSSRENQCYFMYTVEGMSFSRIAEELNISKSSVQRYIERAREKITSVA